MDEKISSRSSGLLAALTLTTNRADRAAAASPTRRGRRASLLFFCSLI
ncbi:Uncharacterised protein [Flavonifractor plautii]|uniref:Uncharacterized protein n=1 Tax=Flavonifractor plautii TaxID=292800 RepID=A0A174QCG9_FLAPL|nr:Uncharacterised protein [Flavonifractor plautii]